VSRPEIRLERRLPHSVERVWRAITEPDELERWSPAVPVWELRPGATFTSRDAPGSGEVVAVDPPRLLAYTWGEDEFEYVLRDDGDGCVLVFTHRFGDPDLVSQHARGWQAYLGRLDVHLAGGHLFELDAHALGSLERATDRPRLRFARRLAHPPDRVWRAITEPDELAAWFPDTIVVGEWAVGASLRFEPAPGMGEGFDGEVLAYEPPRLVEFSWGTDVIRNEIEPDAQGSLLTLVDTIDSLGKAARDGAGWHVCLDQLEHRLDGTAAPWTPGERWRQLHPAYVGGFGPDAATIGPPEGAPS
jgi:uncharacterized protein YndB with AHSA1/START domain